MQRSKVPQYDYILFFTTLALIIIGILFIYSSGVNAEGIQSSDEYLRQIVWAGTGLIFMVGISFMKHSVFYDVAPIFYILLGVLLLFTLFAGTVVNGARSWLGFASFGIQPSEFMKIGLILMLAHYLEKANSKEIESIRGLLKGLMIMALPIILVLLQPDLGTALVYLPLTIAVFYAAGARPVYLGFLIATIFFTGIFIVLPEWEQHIYSESINFFRIFTDTQFFIFSAMTLISILVISIIAFLRLRKQYFFWIAYFSAIIILSFLLAPLLRPILQDHQMMRLLIFLDPHVDPRGAGWNIIQSITAVGSGGFWGKGFLAGTQSHLQFLPQQSTDFIFSILAEEWGFLGGLLVTVLYAVIIMRGISIASQARDRIGTYIAIGICAMYFFHYSVTVGMSIGIMPITGIPLLFLSYGGSSLWTAMIGMGILISISRSRFI